MTGAALTERLRMTSKTNIDKAIEDKQAEIAALILKRDGLAALEPAQQVAEELHSYCGFAHEDQCGWYYHSWTDAVLDSTRQRYLEHAQRLLAHCGTVEESIAVIHLVRKGG